MASISVPSPGKVVNGVEIGPCVEPCSHIDCEASRTTAASNCYECSNPIGYEVQYFGTACGVIHAACAYGKAERERVTKG